MIDKIKSDLLVSMKSKDTLRVSVLRMLISALQYKKIDHQGELTDEQIIEVIQKEAKKRREAIESYTQGNRPDQVAQETAELSILQTYLPKLLTELEIEQEVKQLITKDSLSEFGPAMRIISPHFKGRADGKEVAKIVKNILDNS